MYLLEKLELGSTPIETLLRLAHEISQMSPPQFYILGLREIPRVEALLRNGNWDDAARELVGATATILHFEPPGEMVIIGAESDYAKGTYSHSTVAQAILGAWLNMLLTLCDKVSENPAYLHNVGPR